MTVFALLCALAIVIGLAWLVLEENNSGHHHRWQSPTVMIDRAVLVLVFSFVGARLGYVAVHMTYFRGHPLEIFQTWLGGLSGPGAAMGGMAGVLIVGQVVRISPFVLADQMTRIASLLSAAVCLGCWQMGSAYGSISDGWWAVLAIDEWGKLDTRLPIQLAGAVFALVWVAFLDLQAQARVEARSGLRSAAWLLGMSVAMILLSFGRADPVAMWSGLRVDTWGWALGGLVGLIWLGMVLLIKPLKDQTT